MDKLISFKSVFRLELKCSKSESVQYSTLSLKNLHKVIHKCINKSLIFFFKIAYIIKIIINKIFPQIFYLSTNYPYCKTTITTCKVVLSGLCLKITYFFTANDFNLNLLAELISNV